VTWACASSRPIAGDTLLRALFLTHYFPPEVGAPQTRIAALARGLRDHGIDVTVHTGFPNYPNGRILPPYRNRPLMRESAAGGPKVIRSAVYPAPNTGFGRRLANHASFAGSALATAGASGHADVVVAESPPLFLAAAGAVYARLKHAPLVLNVADLWPDTALAMGAVTDPRAIAAARALEEWTYRQTAAITVPTEGMVDLLERRPAARGRALHMAPAVDLERFEALPSPRGGRPLRVLYAGTVGLAQGLSTLVTAARLAGPEIVQVTIAGDGAEATALARQVRAEGVTNVALAGTLPAEAIPGLYANADAGVIALRDLEILADALPTKLLECLAAGRPAFVSARGTAARLVEDAGAGVVVAPEDPAALAAAFRRLAQEPARVAEMGTAGRAFAQARFGRAEMVARWAALLERVAAQRRARR
jgi:glycosyltransferase involved in cell wall biosynthesis